MKTGSAPRRMLILGSLKCIGRLTWVEIAKLVSHRLFPAAVIITLVVTAGLALSAKSFTDSMGSMTRFTNYSLWVVSAGFGLQVGMLLLVALGAMAMSAEATGRTLNTVLARPIRRIEFAAAKALSLVFATAAVVLAAALAAFVVGGTVEEHRPRMAWGAESDGGGRAGFPSYGDIVDPGSGYVIASRGEVIGHIVRGFALLIAPALAGVCIGFLIGTLIDSSGLAVGLSVGLFVSLEASKFIPLLQEHLGRWAFNYPLTRISTLMYDAGKGILPQWHDAYVGASISSIYIAICLGISLFVFCRRDITL